MRHAFFGTVSFLLAVAPGCSQDESPAPAASPPPAAAEPAQPAEPSAPAGQKRVTLGPLSDFVIVVPEAATITDDGGDAMIEVAEGDFMFHVGRSEGDDTRAHTEQGYAEAAPTLTVDRAEDLPDGWLVVARRAPQGFDFKRYRSDVDLMCYQRVMSSQQQVNQAIEQCASIARAD